jgi:uncharacterized short protein YbdD (DUF466 family)
MRRRWLQLRRALRTLWLGVRQWSGDSAYETYLACAQRQDGQKTLSPSEFYVEQLNRKYSRPNRCC